MPLPLIAAIAQPLINALSKQGLELLSGFFNNAADAGVDKVSKLMKQQTGISMEDIAEEKLTPEQWRTLKEFELKNQELIIQELETAGTLEISRLQLANEDRRGAREMQIEAAKSDDWITRHFIHIYASVVTVLTFGFIGVVVLGNIYELAPDPAIPDAS